MLQQVHVTILIAATLLAQCVAWGGAGDVLPSPVAAGGHADRSADQALPGGIRPVAALQLITSQTLRLGQTEGTSEDTDPARLLPAASTLSPPGYRTGDSTQPAGLTPREIFCNHAVDRNPPLRL